MDDQKYVTRLMRARCSKGTMENYLNVDIDHGIVVGADMQPLMNANDHVAGRHVIHFGCCESDQNPERMFRKGLVGGLLGSAMTGGSLLGGALLGGAISDVLEDVGIMTCKCKPNTPNPWEFVNEDSIVEGAPALMVCSTLTCRYGGVIEIIDPAGDGNIALPEDDAVPQIEAVTEATPAAEDSAANQQEAREGPDTTLLGIVATTAGQFTGPLLEATGNVLNKQVSWLAQNAANTLKYSANTIDDIMRYAYEVSAYGEAASIAQTASKYLYAAKYTIPVVGAAIDFGLQLVGGEEVGHAAAKTAVHAGIGFGVGYATTAAIAAIGGGPVGWVLGAGVVVTVGACYVFDRIYDKNKENIENFVDSAADVISSIGDAAIGFLGDFAGAFS